MPDKNPKQPTEKELDSFLSKVDEIDNVIKGLNSDDSEARLKYMNEADELIKKVELSKKQEVEEQTSKDDLPQTRTGFSRTSINKNAYKHDDNDPRLQGPNITNQQPMDQETFMAAMEADAIERNAKKKERMKTAEDLKEKGNAEFKQGRYEKALEFYDKAMAEIRDNLAIYTNRAQTRNKLGMYKEALDDCHWALRLFPNSLKAYVQQGHAHVGLKEFEKARESYRQILSIDKTKESLVKEYVSETDRVEQSEKEEEKASKLFSDGNQSAVNMVDLITRVGKPDQLPLYYSGGFRVIAASLADVDSQTLFRTNGGLELTKSHPLLSRCLTISPSALTKEERDVVSAALDMLLAACKNNETSQHQMLGLEDFPNQLLNILESKTKNFGRLMRTSCLNLLHEISVSVSGRMFIVNSFDIQRLVNVLLSLMSKTTSYGETAAALLNNIALDRRLKSAVRENIEESILPNFEALIVNNKTPPTIVSVCSTSATNLAGDVTIRNKMAGRASLWVVLTNLLPEYLEQKLTTPLESILGLMVNMSQGSCDAAVKDVDSSLVQACYDILQAALSEVSRTRCLTLISNLLTKCESGCELMSQPTRLGTLVDFLSSEEKDLEKSALKCMAAVTQKHETAQQYLADNKGTSILLKFLTSTDENVVGNAALCLSHLAAIPRVSSKLTKTNVIQKLLTLARDGHNSHVQSNCAILIGKLAQADSRHLERLRELHGIEILHDCMKHVKTSS